VMNEKERYAAVRGCKWVDEVVEDAPYVTDLDWMDRYKADFCVHGEDASYDENGRDTYWKVKEAGRFRCIKRTQGVSTTDLVGRMLLMTMDHLPASVKSAEPVSVSDDKNVRVVHASDHPSHPVPWASPKSTSFLASSLTMTQFAMGNRPPTEDDRIVYIDGAFDLFHVGHIEALRIARSFGTYLIVGVHDDAIVHQMKGSNLPLMNVHERTLSVLQCRHVDQAITGAPWHITEQVIRQLKVSVVVRGTSSDYKGSPDEECYKVPKELGIYREFPSPMPELTTGAIIERILENRKKFQERNKKKAKGEVAFAEQVAQAHAQHIAHVDGVKVSLETHH
jgi:ethanolamine-phosphate cytidylyltransferase